VVAEVAYQHTLRLHVDHVEGDLRAFGGAVTIRLCGHWEHEDPCRWPHHTDSTPNDAGTGALVTVRYDAEPDAVAAVRAEVVAALTAGRLTGPDGTTTTWGAVRVID
jgi:hypothetical protein